MEKVIYIKVNYKNDWRFWLPLTLGIFVLLNTIVWIVLNGGRWFEEVDPVTHLKPDYYNDLNRIFGSFYMLGYFTIQTNLFIGVMLVILPFFYNSTRAQSWYMGSTVLITITFLVFWFLLAPFYEIWRWRAPYFTISNVFIHGINPIISFIILFMIRKEIVINKRIIGFCSLWMSVFYIYSAIFYGVTSTVDGTNIVGSTIYSFLDLQKLFFIDFTKMPVLGIFLNILLFIVAPLLPIGISWIWFKTFKIRANDYSYYRWMDFIKNRKSKAN